jgi:alpha-galactosidase
MVPGIWMEPETCGDESRAFSEVGRLLHRDGVPLASGFRRFRDLRDGQSADELAAEVASFLRSAGFGYVKLDYNASTGIGCDGAESLGEGLRSHVAGIGRYLDRLRDLAPDVAVELCASGGHRAEPWLLARADLASSSDAFEVREIPIVAANMQRLVPPRQSLIWCTLRAEDSPEVLVYKLASTFLGRVCLSGDIVELSDAQWSLLAQALNLYVDCAPTIRSGTSRRHGPPVASYRHPEGWQAVTRVGTGGRTALAVLHRFDGDGPSTIEVPVDPARSWRVEDVLTSAPVTVRLADSGRRLCFEGCAPFSSAVVRLAAGP